MPETAVDPQLRRLGRIHRHEQGIAPSHLAAAHHRTQGISCRLALHHAPRIRPLLQRGAESCIRTVIGSSIRREDDHLEIRLDKIPWQQLADVSRRRQLDRGTMIILAPLGAEERDVRSRRFPAEHSLPRAHDQPTSRGGLAFA